MQKLTHNDLQSALRRMPRKLLGIMKSPKWAGKIFVGGGFLRSVVAGEPVNDIDVFVSSKSDANALANELAAHPKANHDAYAPGSSPGSHPIYRSDNALTIRGLGPAVQIIHRWVFNIGEDVAESFDFTICCAVFWWAEPTMSNPMPGWRSYCDERFYPDLAAKRLHYRSPERNEDAGGSMLRVLKYYQKGYRIPLDSLGAVIARMLRGVTADGVRVFADKHGCSEEQAMAQILTGLLHEVDPAIDPNHIAHLPSENEEHNENENQ